MARPDEPPTRTTEEGRDSATEIERCAVMKYDELRSETSSAWDDAAGIASPISGEACITKEHLQAHLGRGS
ncbi:hypothetical protein NDU88_007514 [Pleurodeles waltl]|uniref:Uncharacterized protein n=1 Tax=Pleurodeles waltl TaxID=8319 RepID=A0AAV7SSY6_PLEWA|nr:hypothetical protein NDU88_007514 [Pleurodeles waltl]